MAAARKAKGPKPLVHGKHYVTGTDIEVEVVRVITGGNSRLYWREKHGVQGAYYTRAQVEIRRAL